jgi:hypothetical protein
MQPSLSKCGVFNVRVYRFNVSPDCFIHLPGESRSVSLERLPQISEPERATSGEIRNEANQVGCENIGGAKASPAAPEAASDDDDGGDPDPDPERRPHSRKTRSTFLTGNRLARSGANVSNALEAFLYFPDSARAHLPATCATFAISPTTAGREKAGRLPTPTRVGNVTALRFGDLRVALTQPHA